MTNNYRIMNKIQLFLTVSLLIMISCTNNQKDSFAIQETDLENYSPYGGKIVKDQVFYQGALAEKYQEMNVGDTLDIAFTSTVNNVCKAKGCWMKLAINKDEETMVKFKDYGFFVPKDIENDTVIVQGKAFVTEMSVEDQRHYASDAGKSEEEIAAITKPKKTYSFIADGVLIKN